jgi:hypothetical protein
MRFASDSLRTVWATKPQIIKVRTGFVIHASHRCLQDTKRYPCRRPEHQPPSTGSQFLKLCQGDNKNRIFSIAASGSTGGKMARKRRIMSHHLRSASLLWRWRRWRVTGRRIMGITQPQQERFAHFAVPAVCAVMVPTARIIRLHRGRKDPGPASKSTAWCAARSFRLAATSTKASPRSRWQGLSIRQYYRKSYGHIRKGTVLDGRTP